MAEEKPASWWGRIGWSVAAWVVGAPISFGLWVLIGPWSLVLIAPAVWTTWDYLRRGGMADVADEAARMGAFLPGAWRRDDRSG